MNLLTVKQVGERIIIGIIIGGDFYTRIGGGKEIGDRRRKRDEINYEMVRKSKDKIIRKEGRKFVVD